jgi:uncharacterized membrane protein YqjE
MNRTDLRDRSLGELLAKLASDIALLFRQEFELAQAELKRNAAAFGQAAVAIAIAAVAGLAAFGAITACLILALALALPAWLAALIVAILYGAAAGVLAASAKRKLAEAASLKPHHTVETLKEDVEWTKTQFKSGGK